MHFRRCLFECILLLSSTVHFKQEEVKWSSDEIVPLNCKNGANPKLLHEGDKTLLHRAIFHK